MKTLLALFILTGCALTFPLPRHDDANTCYARVAQTTYLFNFEGEPIATLYRGAEIVVTGLVPDNPDIGRIPFLRVVENDTVGYVQASAVIINTACYLDLTKLSSSEIPVIDPSLHTP